MFFIIFVNLFDQFILCMSEAHQGPSGPKPLGATLLTVYYEYMALAKKNSALREAMLYVYVYVYVYVLYACIHVYVFIYIYIYIHI